MHVIEFDHSTSGEIARFVTTAAEGAPSGLDMRLADTVLGKGPSLLPNLTDSVENSPSRGILLNGLPTFEDVDRTKILTLLVADAVGRLTAYADYNGSILTDIRPNPLSREQNARPQRLGMHNDFPFIADDVRPRFIILAPHIATGLVPRTLLAPADEIVAALDSETIECLRKPRYSAMVGAKLAWSEPRRYTFPLLIKQNRHWRVLYHFDSIDTDISLPSDEFERFDRARRELGRVADEVGEIHGLSLREGEAVIVPNDHYLHGREAMETDHCERLVFRAYANERTSRPHWSPLMIRLDNE